MAPKAKPDVKRKLETKGDESRKQAKVGEEGSGEREKDAEPDRRPQVQTTVGLHPSDMTLNVVPAMGGRVLMALADGGMQYMIAGARSNVGLTAGRHLFEIKILEALNPADPGASVSRSRVPAPKQLVRVGFSAAGSSLVLGDSDLGVCFDSEGFYTAMKKRSSITTRLTREQVLGVMLNLDPSSPHANTVSLFRDGERDSEPQPLPECMLGKPLFAHVAFRNLTLQVNFGPEIMRPLPFRCLGIQAAVEEDVAPGLPEPLDGKYEVVFPISLPDEGTFDWLDSFLQANPGYIELSDRMVANWAVASGMWKQKGTNKHSNDKPEFNFGIPSVDDVAVRRALGTMATAMPRNYVVMEVRQNLIKEERMEALKRFAAPHFRKVAKVIVGEPDANFRQFVRDCLLKEKKEKVMVEWRAKKETQERKRQMELRQKQLADLRKKAEDTRKRLAEAKKDDDGDLKKDEDVMKDEDEDIKEEEEEVKEEAEPEVELTEDEEKLVFRPHPFTDLTPLVLSRSFANFSIPGDDEGFDDVLFEWGSREEAEQYMSNWVGVRKATLRIEDFQPTEWSRQQQTAWSRSLSEWQAKQKEYDATVKAKKKEEETSKEKEKKEEGGEEHESAEEEDKVELDIYSVEDVCNVGDGEPLFHNFTYEDWALVCLRFELLLMVEAFAKAVDDPERPGILEQHAVFYYNKLFGKTLIPKLFGMDTVVELVRLVKDTVSIEERGEHAVLVSHQPTAFESLGTLVKLTEEARRERQRRLDAGDETVRLKFSAQLRSAAAAAAAAAAVAGAGASKVAASARPAGKATPGWQGWGAGPGGPMGVAGRWPGGKGW